MDIKYNILFLNEQNKLKYEKLYDEKNYNDDAGLDIYMMEKIIVPKKQ